ncbi:MAG TPA: hypothetical protein V6D29_24040 [Leptolyngbyaceae cyanobacterium]
MPVRAYIAYKATSIMLEEDLPAFGTNAVSVLRLPEGCQSKNRV